MKKVFVFIVLCALTVGGIQAQNYIHSWKMGPLSWNDFVHKSAIGNKCSNLEYYMGIRQEVTERDGVKYTHPAVYAFMSPEFSWADTAYRTPALLAYNQCAFDMVEVERRLLENHIYMGFQSFADMIDPGRLLDNTMQRVGEDIVRLEQETREGRDTASLRRWQEDVSQRLDSIRPHAYTTHRDAPLRWGFSFDLGASFVGGNLSKYLRKGFALGFTGDMGIRRHFLTTMMLIGGSRCLDTIYHVSKEINDLYRGDRLTHLDFYIAYGYAVVDNSRTRLTPFVGYGWQNYSYTGDDEVQHGPTDGCLHVGIDYHHNFSNYVEFNEFLGSFYYNAEHRIASFHTKLFATYNRFEKVIGAPTGFTINLQVGLALLGGRAHCE
ncbi:MAG: hypothetical protein J5641_01325 [Bacteroidales bacterium]|nr:hypothetical protein [Bacteroidales bacterium]